MTELTPSQSIAAYHGDRRRAAMAWSYYLSGDHLPEQGHEGLTEILESAKAEGRLEKQLLAIMAVARDVVPQLRTPALAEIFLVKGTEFAQQEADALVQWQPYDNPDHDD